MENKQLLLKTFLLNMASYYKVGFSWSAKNTPSVDKNLIPGQYISRDVQHLTNVTFLSTDGVLLANQLNPTL